MEPSEDEKAFILRKRRVEAQRRQHGCIHVGRTCSSFLNCQCGCLCYVCRMVREIVPAK